MTVPFRLAAIVLFIVLQCSFVSADTAKGIGQNGIDRAENKNKPARTDLVAQLSDEERGWYEKFQEGLLFFSGWKEISSDILAALPPEKQPGTKKLLDELGVRIGTEWSRDNTVRRIDTDQLRSWGDRLRAARNEGGNQLVKAVKRISSEVDDLLCDSCPQAKTGKL